MMKRLAVALAVMCVPAVAGAHIESTTSATADSGGNVVGQGGKVETGDATASAHTQSQTSGSSSSSVYIKTNANGTVREETYTAKKDESVGVSVEATPHKTVTEIYKGTQQVVHEVTRSGTASLSLGERIATAVHNFFAGVVAWFL